MNVCFLGSFDPTYSRNRILIDGLKQNNVRVILCRSRKDFFFSRYVELAREFLKIQSSVDIIFVPFVGQLNMPLGWIMGKMTGKPVVFDMFYSMYNTYVFDRKSVAPKSFQARIYFWIDKIAAHLADHITTDTRTHAEYFVKTFGLSHKKMTAIFVGGDNTVFKPEKQRKRNKLIVEFHGWFTRLHGAEYFVQAAKKLENDTRLKFLLIGSTSNYPYPLQLRQKLKPKTLKHISRLSLSDLASTVAKCDISVGHLGTTEKAKSVISNRTFHSLSCGVATIVGDCSANYELLTNKKNALFTTMGSSNDLAKKIKYLVDHPRLRRKIAQNGHLLSASKLTNKKIGKELLHVFLSKSSNYRLLSRDI